MKYISTLSIGFLFSLSLYAQTVDIPDPDFLIFLITQGIDINNDGAIQTTEAELVEKLISDEDPIVDYTGINAFVNLDSLTIINNDNLEYLEISSLTNLVYLNCSINEIDTLLLDDLPALEHLNCERNSIRNIDLNSLNNLEFIDCAFNGLSELDFSANGSLQWLECSFNNLTELDLSPLPILEFLNCNLNDIATLEVSDKSMLHSINCEQNEMTELTLLNLPGLKSLNCRINDLVTLDVSELDSLVSLNCFNNDIVVLDVAETFDLTFLNCDKNEIEVLDVADLVKLERLECEVNRFSILDVSRLTELRVLDCSNNSFERLDITNLTQLTELDCGSTPLRTLNLSNIPPGCETTIRNMWQLETLFMKNGFEDNIEFPWSLGELYFVCADDFEVDGVISDFNIPGLTVNSYCPHTNGGLPYFVIGQIFYNQNDENCDENNFDLSGVKFHISDGIETGIINGSTSDSYSLRFNEGDYTITPVLDESLFMIEPSDFFVMLPEDDSIVYQDICVSPRGVQSDVSIVFIPTEDARPGFDAEYKVIYTNNGNTVNSGIIQLFYQENVLDYLSAIPIESTVEEGKIVWQFMDLMPFETREIQLSFRVNSPMDTPPISDGDVLSFIANIDLSANVDIKPSNNQSPIRQIVVNSFDPNDKTCLEGTKLEPELVGEFLHYMIRFENTGSAEAINIVVRDSLDSAVLDIETLEIVSSSHRMNTLINGDIVEFVFADIYLPFNDEDNDGNVIFKVKTKEDLLLGDVIENTAAIYFDYNFLIITNTTITTVAITSSTDDGLSSLEFQIFPNPSSQEVFVTSVKEILKLEISNFNGQLLTTKCNLNKSSSMQLNVADLPEGVYLISVYTDIGVSSQTIIVM